MVKLMIYDDLLV